MGRQFFNSKYLLCGRTTCQIPLTFRAAWRSSINFCQLSARRPSINFPCDRETFCQLPSTCLAAGRLLSTFRATERLSVNFCQLPCDLKTFRQLFVLQGSFVNFRQLSMRPEDLPSKFLCGQNTVRLLSVWPGDLPSISVYLPCSRDTFRQPQLPFHAAGRPIMNFFQLSVLSEEIPSSFMQLGDLPSTSIIFQCDSRIFCELLSTSHADRRPSVNFHKHSVQPGELPSTSIKFNVTKRPSVNFHHLSMRSGDLPLITEYLLTARKGYGSQRNVSQLHKMFMEVDGIFPVGKKS